MAKLISLTKRRGYIFQGSEIYEGIGGIYDLGPLGVELVNNLKKLWWKNIVRERDNVVGLDSSILMNRQVWQTSGHVEGFSDPLVECRNCHNRFRADNLVDEEIDFEVVKKEYFNRLQIIYSEVGEAHSTVQTLIDLHNEGLSKKSKLAPTPEEIEELNKTFAGILPLAKKKWQEADKKLKLGRLIIIELENSKSYSGIITQIYLNRHIFCPVCKKMDWTVPRDFNLMFKTHIGPVEEKGSETFLRPETAQGIFVNFGNVVDTMRVKLPFGIAQIGKGFRNEITTGNFLFRVREFEMMELEFFTFPKQAEEAFKYWQKERMKWLESLGLTKKNLRFREHGENERAHYAARSVDVEYNWPFMGWGELEGIANRTDFDLKAHSEASGKDLSYFDEETKQRITPYVIEPSVGLGRLMLAVLVDAFTEEKAPTSEKGKSESRTVLKLSPQVAPIKAAVFPLVKDAKIIKVAEGIYKELKEDWVVQYDESGSVGRRYRRQDEAGTPYCVTVDFDSLKDSAATVRDRDTMKQERIKFKELKAYLQKKL